MKLSTSFSLKWSLHKYGLACTSMLKSTSCDFTKAHQSCLLLKSENGNGCKFFALPQCGAMQQLLIVILDWTGVFDLTSKYSIVTVTVYVYFLLEMVCLFSSDVI